MSPVEKSRNMLCFLLKFQFILVLMAVQLIYQGWRAEQDLQPTFRLLHSKYRSY